jgi:uncharacterized protein with PIN domain
MLIFIEAIKVPSDPRFVVDTMLGNLARWLRILGYDTIYSPTIEDWAILKIAENERRIILTRDVGLYRRAIKKGLEAFLIDTPKIEEMLRELARRYSILIEFNENDTRCPICNTLLRKASSLTEVSGKVDKKILVSYRSFWVCPSCDKIYWKGKHWKTIENILSSIS